MTTYILGAGASRHAGYPLASELGRELYNWILHNKPEDYIWRNCIEELHEVYGGLEDLESILTELDECPPGSRAATFRDVGSKRGTVRFCIPEFFTSLRQRPALLYDRLAHERIHPGDTVITFNYDQACERSLKKAGLWEISDGYGFSLGIDTIPSSRVKVLKLHGSTNWWGTIFGGRTGFFQGGPNSLPDRPVILYPLDFEFLGYSKELCDPLCHGIHRAAALPALITPTRNKRFYVETSGGREWEGFWGGLWAQAGYALRSSGRIVIIGYSMPSADQDARKLLLEKPTKDAGIELFCGQRSTYIHDEFKLHCFTRVDAFKNGRFE